jgi:hypothetical protein
MHRAASVFLLGALLAKSMAGQTSNQVPAQLRNVGIDQKLKAETPLRCAGISGRSR